MHSSNNDFKNDYYSAAYRNYYSQNPPRKLHWYKKLISKYSTKQDKTLIYDFGCGYGLIQTVLDSEFEYYASDINSQALTKVKEQKNKSNAFLSEDSNIPIKKSVFDIVCSFDVLEHLESPIHTMKALSAILKNGGVFIFTVPVYDGPLGGIVKLLDKDETHIQKLSRHSWLEFASEEFEILDWHGAIRYLLPFNYYLHIPNKLFRNYSPAITIICKKKDECVDE